VRGNPGKKNYSDGGKLQREATFSGANKKGGNEKGPWGQTYSFVVKHHDIKEVLGKRREVQIIFSVNGRGKKVPIEER